MHTTEPPSLPSLGCVTKRLEDKLSLSSQDAQRQLILDLEALDLLATDSKSLTLDQQDVLREFCLFTRTYKKYCEKRFRRFVDLTPGASPADMPDRLDEFSHPALLTDLRRLGYNRDESEAYFEQALAFFRSTTLSPGPHSVTSGEVDDVWHALILRTREYRRFCQHYFGKFIHHAPWNEPKKIALVREDNFEFLTRPKTVITDESPGRAYKSETARKTLDRPGISDSDLLWLYAGTSGARKDLPELSREIIEGIEIITPVYFGRGNYRLGDPTPTPTASCDGGAGCENTPEDSCSDATDGNCHTPPTT